MREILFRGKRLSDNQWIYGGYYTTGTESLVGKDSYIIQPWDIRCVGETIPIQTTQVFPDTVGMCVPGITNKNGKRIFEGDILDYFGISYVVSWSKELLTYIVTSVNEEKEYLFYLNKANMDKVYVVGNIHDNPELLEVEI